MRFILIALVIALAAGTFFLSTHKVAPPTHHIEKAIPNATFIK